MPQNRFDARLYAKNARGPLLFAFKLLARNFDLIHNLTAPVKLVDGGCGSGQITKLLATSFYNVDELFAFDVSPEMIQQAKLSYADRRISYLHGDWMNLCGFLAPQVGQIDLVTAFGSLHYAKDVRLVLNDVHTMLKFDGILLGYMPIKPFVNLESLRNFVIKESKWKCYFENTSVANEELQPSKPWICAEDPAQMFAGLLLQAGFKVLRCALDNVEVSTRDEERRAMVEYWLHRYTVLIEDPILQEQFQQDCYDHYCSTTNDWEKIGLSYISHKPNHMLWFAAQK